MEPKHPKDSITIMTEMVMPNDTNPIGNLMGGNLMKWMDVASGICARRHSNHVCVTASVDSVSFTNPIKVGDAVTLIAKVTRAFNTSMEVHIKVHTENRTATEKVESNEAFFTFVALDRYFKPAKVPELIPETEEEKALFDAAKRRRELRLILAGRMEPDESPELKALFK